MNEWEAIGLGTLGQGFWLPVQTLKKIAVSSQPRCLHWLVYRCTLSRVAESRPRISFPRASSEFDIPAECISDIGALSGLEGRVIFFQV